jgi:hypothetical protein
MASELPARPAGNPNRWTYQGTAGLAKESMGDLVYRGALVLALVADAAAFSTVVSIIMHDQSNWQIWPLVAGLTVIALTLAHFGGRIARDDAVAHGRIRWKVVLVCAIPWGLLGLAAVWVRMLMSAPTGGIQLDDSSGGQDVDRLAAALLFLVLYIASGTVAGVGEFLTRNPLRTAYRGLLKAYHSAQRKLAKTQPSYERAMFVRELHRASFEEDDAILLNAKRDRIAYGEELKQYAQIMIAAHLQDPSATDGMTERDWRPAAGKTPMRLVKPPPEPGQDEAA